MTTKSLYLAGPMTGYDNLNHEKFDTEAYKLRRQGWVVFSPAEHDRENYSKQLIKDQKVPLREVLNVDLSFICMKADAIAMLPGWERSYGARAEHATAVALGLEVMYVG